LIIYSSKECPPNITSKISKYLRQFELIGLPYWIFVENSTPIAIIAIGKEPLQLLAPPGTLMAMIRLIGEGQELDVLQRFVVESLRFLVNNNVEYAVVTLSADKSDFINALENPGFDELDDFYVMVCPLNKVFEPSSLLKFQEVDRGDMRYFIKLAHEFMQGSPDVTLTIALQYFLELPESFIDFYYRLEKFYLAFKANEPIGVLSINPKTGAISNIGVSSSQRGKGYGRQIMLFGLKKLGEYGCKMAQLRVHVNNKPAIHLYESLGFTVKGRYKTLIWRRRET